MSNINLDIEIDIDLSELEIEKLVLNIFKIIDLDNQTELNILLSSNKHIKNYVNNIIKSGSESIEQLEVYKKDGFPGLRKYLIDNVEYNY